MNYSGYPHYYLKIKVTHLETICFLGMVDESRITSLILSSLLSMGNCEKFTYDTTSTSYMVNKKHV